MFKIQTKELVCLYREFKKSQNLECKNTLPYLAEGLYLFFGGRGGLYIKALKLIFSPYLRSPSSFRCVANANSHQENKLFPWEGEAVLPNTNPLGFEILTGPKQKCLVFVSSL